MITWGRGVFPGGVRWDGNGGVSAPRRNPPRPSSRFISIRKILPTCHRVTSTKQNTSSRRKPSMSSKSVMTLWLRHSGTDDDEPQISSRSPTDSSKSLRPNRRLCQRGWRRRSVPRSKIHAASHGGLHLVEMRIVALAMDPIW